MACTVQYFLDHILSYAMSNEFLIQKVSSILQGNKGKTLQEMIHELGVSKVSTLKWLQSLEKDGLVYRTSLIKAGQKGRPQNVYHPTKNLKVFSDKESSNVVVIDFSKLKIICRYEKGGMCKALLPKLQRCESSICPYLK